LSEGSWRSLLLNRIVGVMLVDDELQYDHLAAGLAEALKADSTVFDAHRLKKFTGSVSGPFPFFLDKILLHNLYT
jgi:hypothetical protein